MNGKMNPMREDQWNITDPEKKKFSLEMLQELKKLVMKYRNAMKALGGVGKKSSHTLRGVEEMARSNLKSYERCHGITEDDNHLL